MTRQKSKNITFENAKFLIGKFLKPEEINWPREIKLSKQLLALYPEIEFWQIFELKFLLNSLAWFLTDEGEALLNKEYKISSLDLPQLPEFDEDNENQRLIQFPSPPKFQKNTISEFLK